MNIIQVSALIKTKLDLDDQLNPGFIDNLNIKEYVIKHINIFKFPLNESEINKLINIISEYLNGPKEPKAISIHEPGWVKESISNDKYQKEFWDRYAEYLMKDNANFPVPSLNKSTDKILDYLNDPKQEGSWCRKGMVVGHVQSGKTSNYIGLINKAIGHGYKFIIVLTGMYDDLRIQTQERIDYGIIGKLSSDRIDKNKGTSVGVGESNFVPKGEIMSLTSMKPGTEGDYKENNWPISSKSKSNKPVFIISIKKNKFTLNSLIKTLTTFIEPDEDSSKGVKNLPTLIIDDEADSASVDTSKEEDDPKTINRSIRIILNMLEKVTYVGYTATPYANIFIEPSDNEKEFIQNNRTYNITKDLFPSDFIINLKAPKNYFGPHKVFFNEYNYLLVKKLEDFEDNYRSIFPAKIKTETKLPESLPKSLIDAIIHFILTASIRHIGDGMPKHNSMLVHVSLRVLWMDRIAVLIHDYIEELKKRITEGDEHTILIFKNKLMQINDDSLKLKEEFESDLPNSRFKEVKPILLKTINRISVIAAHGGGGGYNLEHEKTDFEYGEKYAQYLICVGGNRLSRGITLKGLTTSYFIRVSKMYDSLMQMGRWFGYRDNYSHLCRLYSSNELAKWYRFITEATEELRNEFNDLNHNTTPKNYSLKVRKSNDILRITSLGKMRYSKTIPYAFDGKSPTLTEFNINANEQELNKKNLIKNLLSFENYYEQDKSMSMLWINQSNINVLKLLRAFRVRDKIKHNLLVEFIEKNEELYTNKWRIILIGKEKQTQGFSYIEIEKNGKENKIYSVQRKHDDNIFEDDIFKIGKDSLTGTAKDKYLDYRIINDKEITQQEALNLRNNEGTPLILLYLIDGKKSLGGKRGEGKKSKVFKSELKEEGVIIPAYFIVFPEDNKNLVKKVNYQVNIVNDNYG